MVTRNDYDIIFVALPRWDGPYASTAFSLAQELSKHHRIYYLDNPYTWKDLITGWRKPSVQNRKQSLLNGEISIKPLGEQLYAFTSRVVFPINFLPDGSLYNLFERINNNIVASAINKLIKEKNIKNYVLINSFNPFYSPLKLIQKPFITIYQSVDNIEKSNYVGKHGSRKEKEISSTADFVITTSSQLTKKLKYFNESVFCIPNAADTALFSKAMHDTFSKPDEWEVIGARKVIVYTGNICHRLDYELLYKIATAHSDKVLLMIGPSKNRLYEAVGLETLPNVIFTGSKSPQELPVYLQHCDCAIIPFLCNDLTASIYPLKINEYLSSGIPVVSTAFSEDILEFGTIISIAKNHAEFVDAIESCISSNNESLKWARLGYAMENNWENRTNMLLKYIDKYLPNAS